MLRVLSPIGSKINRTLPEDKHRLQHPVHSLTTEEFELLVAVIYQRQGYRVSMSDALSGGKGGDFILARKAERILVQCKKQSQDHRIPVERVRELREAMPRILRVACM